MSDAYDEKNKRLFFYKGYEATQTDPNCWVIFKNGEYIDDAENALAAEKRIDKDRNENLR